MNKRILYVIIAIMMVLSMIPAAVAENKTLTERDYVPETPADGGTHNVTDGKFVTRLTNYNAEENTVQAEVLQQIVLNREAVDALKVGDELAIGNDSVTVETLEKDEYGVTVNDEIYLVYGGVTDVIPSFYDHPYYEVIANLTLTIPDSLVFMDGIDPSSGHSVFFPAACSTKRVQR